MRVTGILSKLPLATRRRLLIWLAGALIPALPIATAWYFYVVPNEVRRAAVDLRGTWRLHEGDGPASALAMPNTDTDDDSGWHDIRVPGLYAGQGFKEPIAWYRRNVNLVPALADKTLFITFGDTRGGMARVYVNGQPIGEQGNIAAGRKGFIHAFDGWEVPAGLAHQGENTIAIRMEWRSNAFDGLMDARVLLGDAQYLEPYQASAARASEFLRLGLVYLAMLLIPLLLVLRFFEQAGEGRRKYDSVIFFNVVTIFYMLAKDGLFLDALDLSRRCDLVFTSVALTGLGAYEVVDSYFRGRLPRVAAKIHRTICLGVALMTLLPFLGIDLSTFAVYELFAPYIFVMVLILLGVGVRGTREAESEFAPIFVCGMFYIGVSAANDLLSDLTVISTPVLYSYSLTGFTTMVSAVLLADFLKLHQRSKELSVSLAKSNEELVQALAKAQESTRLKTEFMAAVSHELRTPLTSIINIPNGLRSDFTQCQGVRCQACSARFTPGSTLAPDALCPACGARRTLSGGEMLVYRGEPEETMRYLSIVEDSGRSLLSLVTNILDLAKLEVGKMVLHRENVVLGTLMDDLASVVSMLSARAGVTVEFPRKNLELVVSADPVKLSQIFVHLIGNAIRFSKAGTKVELDIAGEENVCVISVRDHGIGIAKENQQVIFESFRQLDAGLTRNFGGTGLGLAITKQLVALHGGEIWVDSELGHGATFFVKLPLQAERVMATAFPPPPEVADRADNAAKIILAVDDDPLIIETLRFNLRQLRVKVVGVTDARQVMAQVEQVRPDLIVLDIMMPRLSGLSILKQLREHPHHRSVPVLVSSAYEANRDFVLSLGAAWISKPWDLSALSKAVREQLEPREKVPAAS